MNSRPGRYVAGELPPGRRVAQLRARRGMTQQIFANRIGKSKSWVDKVERGLRNLDRFSTIETVAEVLGVTPEILLSKAARWPEPTGPTAEALERVRAALVGFDTTSTAGRPGPLPADELTRRVNHAWEAYRHAHHPQVLRMLPDLLHDARHLTTTSQADTTNTLIRVYRLAAQVLVKLDEPELAWLVADRAMTTAAGDPRHTAMAAIPLTQALRALNRGRLAMTAATTAVQPLALTPSRPAPLDHLALVGILHVQAALAAATCDDPTAVRHHTRQADHLAAAHRDHPDHDGGGDLDFVPVMVDLARALTAAELGDSQHAITLHRQATSGDAWRRLPAEHRAAHLIDISRAYLDLGDHRAAGQALVTADQIAPAETRTRPAAHTALTTLLRTGPTTADVTRLATTMSTANQISP
ncbi:helix-turn-helix transcriptional regulator [Micromonospora sp. NPDC006766]|uniref:helix-turn-helix domain-containing protein n=1 Tax=Micromonospora sp. NPDC006766 TaxID=3154778 RepID=UPI003400FC68